MNDTAISLKFGAEELASLATLLGVKGLLGLGEDVLAGLDEDETRQMLSSGLNSLRAKGWIQEDTDVRNGEEVQFAIDSVVLALFSTCVRSPRVLFISHLQSGDTPKLWYIHFGEHLAVIHRTTLPGVHELVGSVSREDILAEVVEFLHLDNRPETSESAGFSISRAIFDSATASMRDDQESQAMGVLTNNGVNPESAKSLVNSIRNVQSNSMVSLLNLQQADGATWIVSPLETFSLLGTAQELWVIRPSESGKETRLLVKPISGQGCKSLLAHLISGSELVL